MYDARNRTHAPSSLAVPAELRDGGAASSPPALPARPASSLLRWLVPARLLRRGTAGPEPLDEHTLSDIGLSRMDMLYRDPRK